MKINTIVPGHGNVGNMTMLDTLIGYLSLLIQKTKEAHDRKLSLEEFKTGFITPSKYKDWKGVNGIDANLSSLYNFYSK
jgi:cyclase